MAFADNLKKYMKQNNITAAEISEKLGITRSAVTNWSNGIRWPKDDKRIKALAAVLKVGVEDLFNDHETIPVARIPVVGTASCGSTEVSHDQKGRFCYYNGDNFAADLYCVIASGDSMAPDIEDGDEIICNPSAQVQHGDMVHYTLHGESAVKVFVRNEEAGIISLKPYNSSPDFKARILRIDDDEMDALKLVKVVAVNKLKFNNRAARLRLVGE